MIDYEKENYRLIEHINNLTKQHEYIIEAVQTVESEYKLKQHIKDPHIQLKSKICLECIQEIKQQLELIRIREGIYDDE